MKAGVKRAKKPATKEQLAVLAAGRAKRAENLRKVIKAEAVKAADASSIKSPLPVVKEKGERKLRAPSISFKKLGMGILAAILIGAGVTMGGMWYKSPSQMLLGVAAVLFVAGGALTLYMSFKKMEITSVRPALHHGEKRITGPANSITIYGRKDPDNGAHIIPDKIVFEQLENPPGMYRKLRNTGKYYYVNECDNGQPRDCILPDNQYCDPRRMLIPVLMKYSQEYYTPVPSLFQRIKPLLFLGLIIVGGLIMVMVGNPAPPPGG